MEVDRRAAERAPARYRPRCPSRSVLYRCVQEHLETWLAGCREGHDDEGSVRNYVQREFRRYLECGVLAHGFARARCGHDLPVAFSCKGRAVCSSCNSRRMVATAAHLTDHVLPDLPVRQWVLAVRKRLRYFLERDAALQGAGLRLFLRAVESCLRACSPDAGSVARLGAVAFIHRFGSPLNAHLHFHCVVIDGVFAPAPTGGVVFHAAAGLDENAIAQVQAQVRRRLARASSCAAACCRRRTRGRWGNGRMAAGFRSTARCASRPRTVPGANVCCATVPAHPSLWSGCANSIPNACSMRAPSPVRAGPAPCA